MNTKAYKAAMACNIAGFFAFICSIIVSGVKAIISGGSSFDIVSLTVLFFLAMLVLDFVALKERKWRNWSIASVGIKATILLIYLPQVIYSIGRMFEYGYRYYSLM